MLLNVILVSTRPGRAGEPIAKWFFERAKQHAKFEAKLVDLKEANLPLLDEPKHPRLRQYEHAHTKAWSATVAAADAFVFVTPEYNYSVPPTLVNAVDYLLHEWSYKPAALVSYGGASGGMRSAQMAKLLLTSVRLMPIPEGVAIPFFATMMQEGQFKANEAIEKSVAPMLDELHRWATALKPMRA